MTLACAIIFFFDAACDPGSKNESYPNMTNQNAALKTRYAYKAYDANNKIVEEGSFDFKIEGDSTVAGAGYSQAFGSCRVLGSINGKYLNLSLQPLNTADIGLVFVGEFSTHYKGVWSYQSIGGPIEQGNFVATEQ